MILFVESKKERGWSIAKHNQTTTLKIKWPTTRLESSMERPWVTEPWLLTIIAGWEQKMQTLSYSVRNRKQSHFHHWFPLHGKWPGSCLSRPWWHVSSPAVPFHLLTWPPHEYMPHTSMNLTPWRTARFATIRFTRASYRSISSRMESRNCLPLDHPYIRTSPSCMSTTSKGEGTVSWPLRFWENRITAEPESVRPYGAFKNLSSSLGILSWMSVAVLLINLGQWTCQNDGWNQCITVAQSSLVLGEHSSRLIPPESPAPPVCIDMSPE